VDELVVVYVSQGPLRAQVAKSKLNSYGIPCTLRYEAIGRLLGLTVDGLGEVEVLVRARDLELAHEILDESRAAPEEPLSSCTP